MTDDMIDKSNQLAFKLGSNKLMANSVPIWMSLNARYEEF
jgi:hypothetical protein